MNHVVGVNGDDSMGERGSMRGKEAGGIGPWTSRCKPHRLLLLLCPLFAASTARGQPCDQCHIQARFGWGEYRGCTAALNRGRGPACLPWDEIEASTCAPSSACTLRGQHCSAGYTCCRADANDGGGCPTGTCWFRDSEMPEGCKRFDFTPSDFPGAGLDGSYCRAPGESTRGLWCGVGLSEHRYIFGGHATRLVSNFHEEAKGDDVFSEFGAEILGLAGTALPFGQCIAPCTNDTECAMGLKCSNGIAGTPRNHDIPGCVGLSMRSFVELHSNFSNDERLQDLAERDVRPPDFSRYASYTGESQSAVVEAAERYNAKIWFETVLREEGQEYSRKHFLAIRVMQYSCIEQLFPLPEDRASQYTHLADEQRCRAVMRNETSAISPLLASEYVFDELWKRWIRPGLNKLDRTYYREKPDGQGRFTFQDVLDHADMQSFYCPDCHYCYDPTSGEQPSSETHTRTQTLIKYKCDPDPEMLSAPSSCDPCEGKPLNRRGCECGVALHQRAHRIDPAGDLDHEAAAAPVPHLDTCFINEGVTSSYCAATPVASFPYTAWHRSEPSGMVAAVSSSPGTKYARTESFNLGFIESYGTSIIDSTMGGAGSACAEAMREYLCYTLQPRCRFDAALGAMRACGTCRGVCAHFVDMCSEGIRTGMQQVAVDVLTNPENYRNEAGVCSLDDEGFEYDTDFTRQALRDFFFPNCTRDFDETHCTSSDASMCPTGVATPSALFRKFDAADGVVADELGTYANAAKLTLSAGVGLEVLDTEVAGAQTVLSVPSGNSSSVSLSPGLPQSVLSSRVDQYTLVGDFYFEPAERFEGESASGVPSGGCNRDTEIETWRKGRGPNVWDEHIGFESYHHRRPSSCLVFNEADHNVEVDNYLRYCPLLGVMGGCMEGEGFLQPSQCGVKFSVGVYHHEEMKGQDGVGYQSFFLAQHRIIAANDTGPDSTWMRVVISVDPIAGYVRVLANAGEGQGKVFDETWFQQGAGRNGGEHLISDDELRALIVNPGGFLALTDRVQIASDCNSASKLGSLTVFPIAMKEPELQVLAGDPFAPTSFMVEVAGAHDVVVITEDAEAREARVAVRLLHPPLSDEVWIALEADQPSDRLPPVAPLKFTRANWNVAQSFVLRATDDDRVQRQASETVTLRVVPSETTLWPPGQDGAVRVELVDDDVAFIKAEFDFAQFRAPQSNASSAANTSEAVGTLGESAEGTQSVTHTFTSFEWCPVGFSCVKTTSDADLERESVLITIEEGSSTSYTLVLGSEPLAAEVKVIVEISTQGKDAEVLVEAMPSELIFTDASWSTPQTVTLRYKTQSERRPQAEYHVGHLISSRDDMYNSVGDGVVPIRVVANPMKEENDATDIIIAVIVVSVIVISILAALVHRKNQQYNQVKIAATDLKKRASTFRRKAEVAQASLEAAQKIISKVTAEGGSLLDPWKLNHADIVFANNLEDSIIGEGSFGTVYKAVLFDQVVAVKTMRSTKVTENAVREFIQEIKLMAPLRHPNLVNLLGGCWTDGPDKFCLVLEYASLGSLAGLLAANVRSGFKWSKPYFDLLLGVAKCMRYLHHEQPGQQALIHRDIKPANVLIAEGVGIKDLVAKVADFGESRRWEGASLNTTRTESSTWERLEMTQVGTPLYCAPEVMIGDEYTPRVDVYSFGVTLFEVLTVCNGEASTYMRDEFRKHTRGMIQHFVGVLGWRPEIPARMRSRQPRLCALIQRLWAQQDSFRPDFKEVVSTLDDIGSDDVCIDATSTDGREEAGAGGAGQEIGATAELGGNISTNSQQPKMVDGSGEGCVEETFEEKQVRAKARYQSLPRDEVDVQLLEAEASRDEMARKLREAEAGRAEMARKLRDTEASREEMARRLQDAEERIINLQVLTQQSETELLQETTTSDRGITLRVTFKYDPDQQRGVLGEGSYGKVYAVKSTLDGNSYAMKRLGAFKDATGRVDSVVMNELLAQVQKLRHIKSEYLVHYVSSSIAQQYLYIVMERLHGVEFKDLVVARKALKIPFLKPQIARWAEQLAAGLSYLHDKAKVIHQDLHDRNVMVTWDPRKAQAQAELVAEDDELLKCCTCVKILDLGMAPFKSDHAAQTLRAKRTSLSGTSVEMDASDVCGCKAIRAPEMWSSQADGRVCFDAKVDVWALALLVCEAVLCSPIEEWYEEGATLLSFGKDRGLQQAKAAQVAEVYPRIGYSVRRMLAQEPRLRPSAHEVLYDLTRNAGHAAPRRHHGSSPPLVFDESFQSLRVLNEFSDVLPDELRELQRLCHSEVSTELMLQPAHIGGGVALLRLVRDPDLPATERAQKMISMRQERGSASKYDEIRDQGLWLNTVPGSAELREATWETNEWIGVDSYGDIVVYERWGAVDPAQMLRQMPIERYSEWFVYRTEARAMVLDVLSRRAGHVVSFTNLIDLAGARLEHRRLILYYKEFTTPKFCCPYLNSSTYCIQSNSAFVTLFGLGKRLFFSKRDRETTHVYSGRDPCTTSTDFAARFGRHVLPTTVGGTLEVGEDEHCCLGVFLPPACDAAELWEQYKRHLTPAAAALFE